LHTSPFATFLVRDQHAPRFAIDVYPTDDEYAFTCDAIVWHDTVAVGFGHTLSFVDCVTRSVSSFSTQFCSLAYFSAFCRVGTDLLVATGCGLMRFAPPSRPVWQVGDLGLDGVVVSEVRDGLIVGEGEWDPPGGWRPFKVDFETGAVRP
jgi:hypothetical protein